MAYYENVFIARQDISAAQADALADRFAEIVETGGGKVTRRENWGLRSLAFRIRKNRKGHYVMLNIDAPAEAVQELERTMRLDEDVIRYMTIRVDALDEAPSPMMKTRGRDRDDHDRRPGRGDSGGRGKSGGDGKSDDAPRRTEEKDGKEADKGTGKEAGKEAGKGDDE